MLSTLPVRPAAWALLALGALSFRADPDLWGHVRFGLDLWRTRHLTAVDPYSFTQDVPWINHEWLSEFMMAAAYAAAGSIGLLALKAALVSIAFAVVLRALRGTADHVRWLACAFSVWAAAAITTTLRPQLWTLLLLAVLCRLLIAGGRAWWWIPILFTAWANLHGGWVVGLGVLGAWSGARILEARDWRLTRRLALIGVLSAAATLATPYGWELWRFLWSTVSTTRADIGEWRPLWKASDASIVIWPAALALALASARGRGRSACAPLAVAALLAYTSLRVMRLVPLFVEVVVILCAPFLPRDVERRLPDPRRLLVDLAVAAVVTVIALGPGLTVLRGCVPVAGRETWVPDTAAAQALIDGHARGRIVTWFDWGEYAIWHLSPALKVSFDGRRETVYSRQTIQEQVAISIGEPAGLAALARVSPEYVWLPPAESQRTERWLRQHGYRIDIETPRSFVAVRGDLPALGLSPTTSPGCFP